MSSLLFVTLTAGFAAAQEPDLEPLPARVIVRLPAEARLFIDGVLSSQRGPMRTVVTPALTPGFKYYYTLRAETMRDDGPVRRSKKVYFRAGETRTIDFGDVGRNAPTSKAKKASRPQPA